MIVYVLTPSLNKSFKFQSDWPYNNSQSYLLQTLLQDMKNDKNKTVKETDDGYMVTTVVHYSSNKSLVSQNIYFDKDKTLVKVEVLDQNNQAQITMEVRDVDMKANFDKNYFDLNENMATAAVEEEATTVSKIDDVIYPMYIPDNTKLTSQDKVNTTNGERIILTFSGDKPFMFVQETSAREKDFTTIPVSGEPSLLKDTVGSLTETSATWVSGGVEYYVVSDSLTQEEILSVVNSISSVPIGK